MGDNIHHWTHWFLVLWVELGQDSLSSFQAPWGRADMMPLSPPAVETCCLRFSDTSTTDLLSLRIRHINH